MKQVADVNTLRAFGNLKDTLVEQYIKDALADIDRSLRRAEGEKHRVLQGQAQALEEMAAMIEGADTLIAKVRQAAAPKTKHF